MEKTNQHCLDCHLLIGGLSVWSLYVLSVAVLVSSGHFSVLSQFKDMKLGYAVTLTPPHDWFQPQSDSFQVVKMRDRWILILISTSVVENQTETM